MYKPPLVTLITSTINEKFLETTKTTPSSGKQTLLHSVEKCYSKTGNWDSKWVYNKEIYNLGYNQTQIEINPFN